MSIAPPIPGHSSHRTPKGPPTLHGTLPAQAWLLPVQQWHLGTPWPSQNSALANHEGLLHGLQICLSSSKKQSSNRGQRSLSTRVLHSTQCHDAHGKRGLQPAGLRAHAWDRRADQPADTPAQSCSGSSAISVSTLRPLTLQNHHHGDSVAAPWVTLFSLALSRSRPSPLESPLHPFSAHSALKPDALLMHLAWIGSPHRDKMGRSVLGRAVYTPC